ncbi:MAG TPA: hypothetical protein VF326_07735, partial [Anaerolineaceae bacterium]
PVINQKANWPRSVRRTRSGNRPPFYDPSAFQGRMISINFNPASRAIKAWMLPPAFLILKVSAA